MAKLRDISSRRLDSEPLPGAPPLPKDVTAPFEVRVGEIGVELEKTIENIKRDGIRVSLVDAGSPRSADLCCRQSPYVRSMLTHLKIRGDAVWTRFKGA